VVVSFHSVPGAAEHALPLYSLPDALNLREHVLNLFEAVDKKPSRVDEGALNFCIVGGGATGGELAGALAEMLHIDLAADYPQMPFDRARIILCEHSPHVLGPFKENLRDHHALRGITAGRDRHWGRKHDPPEDDAGALPRGQQRQRLRGRIPALAAGMGGGSAGARRRP